MSETKGRYQYIDNLKLCMIVLVVLVHLSVTYSGIGDWYWMDLHPLDTFCTVLFGWFQSFTQAYFMGILFFVSGFFVVRSYDKKGAKKFLLDRFKRLGIPTLIYMWVIHPFTIYVIMGSTWERPSFMAYYTHYIGSLKFVGSSGPLWFAFALLIFNIIYCVIRCVTKNKPVSSQKALLDWKAAIKMSLGIAICAFLIRLVQPIDTSIINMQLCFFSQYVILFIWGVKWGRYEWFSKLSYESSKKYLFAGIVGGSLIWTVLMVAGGALDGDLSVYKGGFYWQSVAYALWESFVSVMMCIGLVGVFKEKWNRQDKLTKALSDASFGVYMFHTPIITAVALLLRPIIIYPFFKFLLAALIGVPLSFGMVHFILRRIPYLKEVL